MYIIGVPRLSLSRNRLRRSERPRLGASESATRASARESPHVLDDYFADRRSDPTPATVSTLRTQAGAIRAFCNYLTEPLYGWAPFCETVFNDVPSQIVFEWNSPRQTADDDFLPGVEA